jgi:hypothetical protein
MKWADCLLINNLALVLGGAITVCVPFLHEYSLFAAYTFFFGTAIGEFQVDIEILAFRFYD